jgi:hypothetical protein
MILAVFAICQIIVLYVLMFAENWGYFVSDCLRVWLVCMFVENVEIIMFSLLCMLDKN